MKSGEPFSNQPIISNNINKGNKIIIPIKERNKSNIRIIAGKPKYTLYLN